MNSWRDYIRKFPLNRRCDRCGRFFSAKYRTCAKFCRSCGKIQSRLRQRRSSKRFFERHREKGNPKSRRPDGTIRDIYGNVYVHGNCAGCGRFRLMRSGALYCSRKCIWIGRHSRQDSCSIYLNGETHVLRECPQCGKRKFFPKRNKFCCQRCGGIGRRFQTPEGRRIRDRNRSRAYRGIPAVRAKKIIAGREYRKKAAKVDYQIDSLLRGIARLESEFNTMPK
jgi:predicted  nucleic acid-binding Zn-ribbon protein